MRSTRKSPKDHRVYIAEVGASLGFNVAGRDGREALDTARKLVNRLKGTGEPEAHLHRILTSPYLALEDEVS